MVMMQVFCFFELMRVGCVGLVGWGLTYLVLDRHVDVLPCAGAREATDSWAGVSFVVRV